MGHLLKSTLPETFLERVRQSGDRVGFRVKSEGVWRAITYAEFFDQVASLAHGLDTAGVKPGTRVGILSRTRYEWAVADLTILSLRAITVPLHATSTPEDLEFLVNHSECETIFVESIEQLRALAAIEERLPTLKSVILFEGTEAPFKTRFAVTTLRELSLVRPDSTDALVASIRATQLSDTFTIAYTSATTGDPKGVVLTHENLMSVLSDSLEVFRDVIRPEGEDLLTFLPFSHIIGRLELMTSFVFGWRLNFAESFRTLDENFGEVRPTILFAVPRIFDRAYERIEEELGKASWSERKAFTAGMYTSQKMNRLILEQEIIPRWVKVAIPYFRKFILKRVMDAFGGRLRFVVCGGAPLSRPVGEYFKALGIHILEGYGLTETCAPVTLNTLAHTQFGSVGRPLPEVEIRIEEDGEIAIRSRKIFREYFKNPEATAAAMRDGWFLTGDVGFIDPGGFLHITDRKKDLIVLSGGKNIAPQKIENKLRELDSIIEDVLVVGDSEKALAALITLSNDELRRFAERKSILFGDLGQLYRHPKVTERVQTAVDELNRRLSRPERVRKFLILAEPFTQAKGELSISLKVRRSRVITKYYKEIRELFSAD